MKTAPAMMEVPRDFLENRVRFLGISHEYFRRFLALEFRFEEFGGDRFFGF